MVRIVSAGGSCLCAGKPTTPPEAQNLLPGALRDRLSQSILTRGVLEKVVDVNVLFLGQRLQTTLVVAAYGSGRAGNRDTKQDTKQDTKRNPDHAAKNPVRRPPHMAGRKSCTLADRCAVLTRQIIHLRLSL
ncbi:hypothetical protein [Paraburkholderia aspalathi]|uniref:hypothetical protein n=1 Tax=Paraburkholderia aspalathi TaxID=1324617 RepID=UPI0019090DF8|nr:hypothetical protein [Paraburkholderia aspalathi]MBK3840616.1 hypothetical protein [Paraburkholderia aspalathi]